MPPWLLSLIPGGEAVLSTIVGMLGWKGAEMLMEGLGGAALKGATGKAAGPLLESIVGKAGSSAIGQAVTSATTNIPKVGKYLSAESITKSAIKGAAGVGGFMAGQMGWEAANSLAGLSGPPDALKGPFGAVAPGTPDNLGSLLNKRSGLQYQDVIGGLPDGERVRQDTNIAGIVRTGQMEDALAQYIGNRQLAEVLMGGQREESRRLI